MSIEITTELNDFRNYVVDLVDRGVKGISPEEAVDYWRQAHPLRDEYYENELAAIREALADVAAGDRGTPIDEFHRELKERFPFLPDR